jgi:hypothetical protein
MPEEPNNNRLNLVARALGVAVPRWAAMEVPPH